ncbi:hypothetical protein FUT69_02530 [Xylella taiwanensis]|uniref:DUF6973 domain-containing protein n=1 Tax=Xylella taiwanensis TaxID=1444770 RepID=A0ABS8TT43_9GAMM|nr:hypothetical protein [Xylella taiwanensis]MCD8457112.1 hypothetical protein [Xylella taiwanensis]MCD8459520.1 hypothetical protein [Xylella taiwanensis]MCD8461612.1 hypothetical protein [Xylella taiwanensis]MCD8462361.1 hypothetical protein [Xylella taiwanensis]MCD8466144.1 hypothetical protein [Xylella taiwanensis]
MTKYYMRKNASWSLRDKIDGRVPGDVIYESTWSYLPGREDGPADAYRHLLLSAELTRIYGDSYARALLNFHEWDGNRLGQSSASYRMDQHNNELGIAIGKRLGNDPNANHLP